MRSFDDKNLLLKACAKAEDELQAIKNILNNTADNNVPISTLQFLQNSTLGQAILAYLPVVEREQKFEELLDRSGKQK